MNDSHLLVVTAPCDKNIPLLAELRQLGTVVVGDSARGFAQNAVSEDLPFQALSFSAHAHGF